VLIGTPELRFSRRVEFRRAEAVDNHSAKGAQLSAEGGTVSARGDSDAALPQRLAPAVESDAAHPAGASASAGSNAADAASASPRALPVPAEATGNSAHTARDFSTPPPAERPASGWR
jgi:hypothetical protein